MKTEKLFQEGITQNPPSLKTSPYPILSPHGGKGQSGGQSETPSISPLSWGGQSGNLQNSSPDKGRVGGGSFRHGGVFGKGKKAFTLVELIIVITILAILATIAFISFQGYTSKSRDSNRLTTIKTIEKGLEIFLTKTETLPEPENKIDIINSKLGLGTGILLGNQGYIGDTVTRGINLNTIPMDPYDAQKYVYFRSNNSRLYQVMGFMEDDNYSLFQKTFAQNYHNRFPKTFGSELGIVLDMENNPIQGTNGIFDIFDSTNAQYQIYRNKLETITMSGDLLFSDSYAETGIGGEKCSHPDIVLYGPNGKHFIIAACNMGTSISGTGTESYGGLYQWGNNFDFRNNQFSNGEVLPSNMLNTTLSGALSSSIDTSKYPPSTYSSGVFYTRTSGDTNWSIKNLNLWGDLDNTPQARKGPCPEGYHIPSQSELMNLFTTLLNFQCGKLYGNPSCRYEGPDYSVIIKIMRDLKIPLAGVRSGTNGALSNQNRYTVFHSSSFRNNPNLSGDKVATVVVRPERVIFEGYDYVSIGHSIRCFKN